MAFALISRSKQSTVEAASRKPSVRAKPGALQRAAATPVIQPKLTVGKPNDTFEREADRVADEVLRVPRGFDAHESEPAGRTSRSIQSIQRMCAECAEEDPITPVPPRISAMNGPLTARRRPQATDEIRRQPSDFTFEVPEDDAVLQTKPMSGQAPNLPPGFDADLDAIEGRGQRLPTSVRAFFERRLDYDFSSVRVHTDARAHQAARAAHARAFTLGRDIVFGARQYAPATPEGRHLLAHELTHTIQQGAVSPGRSPSSRSSIERRVSVPAHHPAMRPASRTLPMLQKADCNFYVYDSTESTALGSAWKAGALGLASKAWGGFAIASGDSIEEMLYRVLYVYADRDCDCLEEIQFLSHGSPGNAMYISKTGDELTIRDFNIPDVEKYGDGPRDAAYRAWHDKLTTRQQRLVLLRRILCGPGAEVYYRSCEAFQGKTGQEFAKASAAFWRAKVIGHTKVIGLTQPGQKVLKPGQEPDWPESEGGGGTNPKKPRKPADVKPKKD